MTAGRERILRSMQRKMLRIIVNVRRTTVSSGDSTSSSTDDEDEDCEEDDESHLEPWLLWMSRATSLSEEMAQKHGICDWVEDQRRRKWRLAGHMARRNDGRWATKLLVWFPTFGFRSRGRPSMRWGDVLVDFHKSVYGDGHGTWIETAQDRSTWFLLEDGFIDRCSFTNC